MNSPRILEIRAGVLKKNDELARGLRTRLEASGAFTINLVSSPGTGKTALLELMLTRLHRSGVRVAALVGDLETDNDAQRLARSGAPVRQINTHGRCHLEAEMITAHLDDWHLDEIDILFIENVGNLVCPSSYDLGEAMRMVLLSVTEGEDKPLKYPGMFNSADVAVITKADLAVACEFDADAAHRNIADVRPGMVIHTVSSKRGDGVDDLLAFLADARTAWQHQGVPAEL